MRRWFNRSDRTRDDPRPSILEYLLAHLGTPEQPLDADGLRLPDDSTDTDEVRFAPGARDGIAIMHTSMRDEEEPAELILTALLPAIGRPWGSTEVRRLDETVASMRMIGCMRLVHAAVEARVDARSLSREAVHATAIDLASRSRQRETVKLGLVLLALDPRPALDIVRVLGRHDEFTWWAILALVLPGGDPGPEALALAKGVRGWGRVHLVGPLRQSSDPWVGDWLVRGGFRNTIALGYTVLEAVTAGKLVDRLEQDPDEELIDAAGEIIDGFLEGSPGPGIASWTGADRAVRIVLERSATGPPKLERRDLAARLLALATEPDTADPLPWSPPTLEEVALAARRVLDRPDWGATAEAALRSSDRRLFLQGVAAADDAGIDPWPALLEHADGSADLGVWMALTDRAEGARAVELITVAQRVLPLEAIADGPGLELGMGPAFSRTFTVSRVLGVIGGQPGEGWRIVRSALRSSVTSLRLAALRALDAWGPTAWPDAAVPMIEEAATTDPSEQVREEARRLRRRA